jgi:probable F420-dependent oxidoreductase
MSKRAFRFGVVTGRAATGEDWLALAQRVEGFGYSTLLVPDTRHTFSPFAAIAAAGAVTTRLRFGTFVLSAPNWTPGLLVREAATARELTGGRFELGLGAGRPDAAVDAERFGRPFGSPGERLRPVEQAIAAVREQPDVPPIMVAAGGPRALQLAAAEADIIALGVPPRTTEQTVAERVAEIREYAGGRFDDLELALNLLSVGGELPAEVAKRFGLDPDFLREGTPAVLTGTTDEMVATLERRRDELGISYVAVAESHAEALAPVVERLSGS